MRFYLLVLAIAGIGVAANTALAQQPPAHAALHPLETTAALLTPPVSPLVGEKVMSRA